MDLIEQILRGCLAADLTPEVNTSTLRQNLDEPMPGGETIRLYAKLGGSAMTLGSDAHRPEDIGKDFDHAVTLLQEAGLSHMALFNRGIRSEVPLATYPSSRVD